MKEVYRCPNCHCDDSVRVVTESYCRLEHDGSLGGPDHKLPQDVVTPDSHCICIDCNTEGTMKDFKVRGWVLIDADSDRWEIQRDDEVGVFSSDEEAREYVYNNPYEAKLAIEELLEMYNGAVKGHAI